MPLASRRSPTTGDVCEVCGGRDCIQFRTTDWEGDTFARTGTLEAMTEAQAADEPEAGETDDKAAPKPGRRARRRGEDRARRPSEDREHEKGPDR